MALRYWTPLFAILGFLAISQDLQAAQPASSTQATQPETVIRVYDIRDLITPTLDHPAPPTWSEPDRQYPDPKIEKQRQEAATKTATESIIKLIQEVIKPGSWTPTGKTGSIRQLQGNLIITQTDDAHRAIADLLTQMREGRVLFIDFDATFLQVPAEREAALQQWLKKELKPRSWDEKTGVAFLNDREADTLPRRGQEYSGVSATLPQFTLFNGQGGYVSVGSEKTLQLPEADKTQKVAVTFLEGHVLDVEATVSADRSYVTITLRPRVTKLLAKKHEPLISQTAMKFTVSIPNKGTLLLRIPVAQFKAVGVEPAKREGDQANERQVVTVAAAPAAPPAYVYLLVKPTIVVQREHKETATAPSASTQPTGDETSTQPATRRSSPASCISGVVRNAASQGKYEEEVLAKLPTVNTAKEFLEVMEIMMRPNFPVCSNTTVRLCGETVQHEKIARETVTNDQGKYAFNDVQPGLYEIWAELSSQPDRRGTTRTALARATVRVGNYPGPNYHAYGHAAVYRADLNLQTDTVTVRGRVTDAQGKPVAGAIVSAKEQSEWDSAEVDRMIERRSVTSVTNANGTYELRRMAPPDVYPVAGYLNGGSGERVKRLFEVQAEGFQSASRNIPLVTEELLDKSRRMLAALGQLEQRVRQTQPSTKPAQICGEKAGLPLPASSGNVITDIDFVLLPAGTANEPPGR